MRVPALAKKPSPAAITSFPAPVSGWIANVNLSTPNARKPDGSKVQGAAQLDNWFPTATGIRMRAGSSRYAILGDGTLPATALFAYVNGAVQKLFAATANAIYDITTVAHAEDQFVVDGDGNFLVDGDGNFIVVSGSPDVEAGIGTLTGGNWSVVQFATPGGVFLRAVNGLDTPLVFDGTSWSDSPAITGATPSTLSSVWVFKNRLFFIEGGSLDAWYLPVDNIGGAAVKFPMGGVFTLGGSLLFGAAWSLDTGAGLSEQCVFATTEGEFAVYQGSDPSSSSTWTKVGVYRMGKPRGAKAHLRAGGDLLVATDIGLVALSMAVQRDLAALSPAAVSYPIEDAWNALVASRTHDWQCEIWPTKQMVLVAPSVTTGDETIILAANARTGAWAKYTGWDATCMKVFGDRLFFGTLDGRVVEGEVSGSDQSDTYTATCVPLFDAMKTPASLKSGMLARAVLRAPQDVTAKLTLQTDYNIVLPTPPDDTAVVTDDVWGTAVWGTARWGTPPTKRTFQHWRPVPGSGQALSVSTQITSGGVSPPNVDLVQTDLTYETGDPVT